MDILQLVSLLALMLYFILTFKVGLARGRFGIQAPATTGNADFERYYRVQMNTLEHIVILLPAMWSFAYTWAAPNLGAAFGGLWIVGRIIYAVTYYKDAKKRSPGFFIALFATLILIIGAFIGVSKNLLLGM